ncbi:hypothetical protein H4K35_05725 [Myroides sp. NP-2]|uniref:DUF4350 domain-containing protein n=1 Tax=Myroides sp. NP-2 TaxID=2759945 RepID=UPI0015FC730F|nr:DUF4350 domain-containing protein [Myroides sp. NP-2]MBB1149634.1 hypothetical protein [Myroides sp. NP-2]
MNSSLKKFGLALMVLVTCVFIYESGKKKPLSWIETYDNRDKNPYGLYILDQELETLLAQDSIWHFTTAVYDFLNEKQYDTLQPVNLIVLEDKNYDLDQYTAAYLKEFIAAGNTAVILQSDFNNAFLEAFGLHRIQEYSSIENKEEFSTVLELTNNQVSKQKFSIRAKSFSRGFELADSLKNQLDVLGYKTVGDTLKQVNLVRYREEKGHLILGLDPIILTNYYLLRSNNHLYAEGVFSYLPEQKTYMYGSSADKAVESRSLLRFIFANRELKWAWYFFLFGLIVFTLFTAKRKQRIIPIIKPLKNTTVQFTKTVSNLYIQSKDYSDLIDKSIIYTLEKIRRKYYLDTAVLDETFVEHFHLKSNKDKQDILAFVQFVTNFRRGGQPAVEADLVQLNRLTEKILD